MRNNGKLLKKKKKSLKNYGKFNENNGNFLKNLKNNGGKFKIKFNGKCLKIQWLITEIFQKKKSMKNSGIFLKKKFSEKTENFHKIQLKIAEIVLKIQ